MAEEREHLRTKLLHGAILHDARRARPEDVDEGDREAPPDDAAAPEGPPASEPRPIPLEQVAKLDDTTIARIDALAAERGLTREQRIEALVEAGAGEVERLVATSMPLPGGPANDGDGGGRR